jgi:hypothetical protein
MDPYALIAQYPNAGDAFAKAFQGGMQQNALASFAQNPNDPRAQGAAARYDPNAVMQYRIAQQRQQQELSQQELEQWHKTAGEIAKIADTPQKWDEAVDHLVAMGHPEVAQLKGHFSPYLRAQFMALGGVQDDKPQQPHFVPFQQGGGVVAVNPDGTTRMVVQPNDGTAAPGSLVNNGQPLTDDQMRQLLGNGGQTPPASGGFPR